MQLNMEAQGKFKQPWILTRVYDLGPSYIETLELEQESSWKIQTAITFGLGVWLRQMIYRDAQNWTTEAAEKFKWS